MTNILKIQKIFNIISNPIYITDNKNTQFIILISVLSRVKNYKSSI